MWTCLKAWFGRFFGCFVSYTHHNQRKVNHGNHGNRMQWIFASIPGFLNMCDFPLPFHKLQFILGTIFAIGSRSQPQRNQLRGSAVVPRVTLWCFKEGKNWAAWLVHSWVPTFPALVKPRNVWGPGCVRWRLNRISGVSGCYTLVRLIYKLNQLTTGRPYLVEWIPLGGLNHLLWGRELHYARGIPICINMSIYLIV
jgi:hypothetical protein